MSRLTDVSLSAPPVGGSEGVAPALGELAAGFARWLDQLDRGETPWPAFDRWVRDSLNHFIGLRRVRCYSVAKTDQRLSSLTNELDDAVMSGLASNGLIDHLIASGRRYVRDAPGNGELIERLSREWAAVMAAAKPAGFTRVPDWIVPVRERNRTIGLIVVAELPDERRQDLPTLTATSHLLELFWRHVDQAVTLAVARRTDQASGVLSRMDLTAMADRVLHESAVEGEPTVTLAVAIEGVRRLDDQGQWRLRDWLMRRIGREMRHKLRSDDLVGRFSDDRFVAVLRRLDPSLGQLIARKLLEAVDAQLRRQPGLHEMVKLRCGLAEGSNQGFEPVLVRAFGALEQARAQQRDIVLGTSDGVGRGCTATEVSS